MFTPHRRTYLAGVIAASLFSSAQAAELERVIVTATRSPTDLGAFTGSIARIESEEIAQVGATHHTELLNRAPGAQFQRNSGQESLTAIRSPVLAGPGSCGAFLFMEDSIPMRPVGFCNVNQLFEVNMAQAQAVEVLRGPAGSIYGSSAMHGAVNVLTMNPVTTPTVAVALEGAADSFRRGSAVVSFGEDTNAVAIAANITHDGGWRDDSKVDEQKANAAWHLALANSTLDMRIAYARLDQDTAGFIQGFNAYRNEAIARSNPNPEAYRNARALRANAHWHAPLSGGLALDLRPYVRSSRMEFLQHFLMGQPLETNGQDSAGLITTLSSRGDTHTWLGGVDLEYADTFLIEDQSQPTIGIRPIGKHYDYTVQSTVAALYGRYELTLGNVRMHVGARGERVEYDYDNRMSDGNLTEAGTPCVPVGGCLYFRPSDRKDTFETLTPQMGISYAWIPEHVVYATAVNGYRAPESTELYRIQRQQSTETPTEEKLQSIELGMRGSAGMFAYDIAVFTMRKEDLILREANGLNLSNGQTKHRGVEYELAIAPIDSLRFSVSGTHAKHTYDFTASIAGGENIVAGRDIDTAPRNVWNARAAWNPLDALSTELEWQHVGSYWADAANTALYEGHNLMNLRVAYAFLEAWKVTARVINLADRDYADRADFAFGNFRYFPGRGRTVFVEARYEMK
jgi:iron complex outermembrane recepter protein